MSCNTEPSGDSHQLAEATSSGVSLVRTQKSHEKAWYSKYLFRFATGTRRISSRGDRELIATHSAPVVCISASRRSLLSEVNTTLETASTLPILTRRNVKSRREGLFKSKIFDRDHERQFPYVSSGSSGANTLKQKMRELATRQYQVEAERLLININGKIAHSTNACDDGLTPVATAPTTMSSLQAHPSRLGKGKHLSTEGKQERRKALRQILENAEEYMDGVKKCDEILRSLPPLQPLRKEYVEKWLTESSTEYSTSDQSYPGLVDGSDEKSRKTEDKSSLAEAEAPSSDTAEQMSVGSTSASGTTLTTEKTSQTKQKSHRSTRRAATATYKGSSRDTFAVGAICPVHSCTCTLNSAYQNNLHAFACPSSGLPMDGSILEERLFHMIPSPSSFAFVAPNVAASTSFDILPDHSPTTLNVAAELDVFDPIPRLVPFHDAAAITTSASDLLDFGEGTLKLDDEPTRSDRLDVQAGSLLFNEEATPAEMGPDALSPLGLNDLQNEHVQLAKCNITDSPLKRSRNHRRGRFYFQLRLNSRVRQKLSTYISKRKAVTFPELQSKKSLEMLALSPKRHETFNHSTRTRSPVSDDEPSKILRDVKNNKSPARQKESPMEKPNLSTNNPIIAAVVTQNQELVASIANIFATLQSHVQRADDDRRRMINFIHETDRKKYRGDKAVSPSTSAAPIAASRSKNLEKKTVSTTLVQEEPKRVEKSSSHLSARNIQEVTKREGRSLPDIKTRKSISEASTVSKSDEHRSLLFPVTSDSPIAEEKSQLSGSVSSGTSTVKSLRNNHKLLAELHYKLAADIFTEVDSDTGITSTRQNRRSEQVESSGSWSGHVEDSLKSPLGTPDSDSLSLDGSTSEAPSSATKSALEVPTERGGTRQLDSSDNSAVYGTPRPGLTQSLLSLSTRQSRQVISRRDSGNIVESPSLLSSKPTSQSLQSDTSRKQRLKTQKLRQKLLKDETTVSPLLEREKAKQTTITEAPLKAPPRKCRTGKPDLAIAQALRSPPALLLAPKHTHVTDGILNFYISSSSSSGPQCIPLSASSIPTSVHQRKSPRGLEIACQTSASLDQLTGNVHDTKKVDSQTSLGGIVLTTPKPVRPTAAPRNIATAATKSGASRRKDLDTVQALFSAEAFRVNISDSTMVDSETGMTFHPAHSNSRALSGERQVQDENEPSRLNVLCDVERMSEIELQEKLHNLQTEQGTLTPLVELLEYLFYLLGLRGSQQEEDLFLPSCHVEDSVILWNAWKSKIFTVPGAAASPPNADPSTPMNVYALHSIDRLFHFLSSYCSLPSWVFTAVKRGTLETNGDLKALYELFHSGVIEIPADRPKFFTEDVLNNRRSLRLFMMNMFRFDADGQLESVHRQKCLFYIHLFKNDAVGNPTMAQITEYRDLLHAFRLEELTVFSKKDEIFIDITVQQWLSTHEVQHKDPMVDPNFQLLREETKRWLSQTTLINSRNKYGPLGSLRMMANKYLKGVLGNMSHEHRTFISNVMQIEQDAKTSTWSAPDSFLDNCEAVGLEQAVKDYIVPYRFVGGFTLPNQKVAVSKKDVERQETFKILEDICVQESISNKRLAQQAPAAPKADLKASSRTQFYKKQLKDPDIRKHLLGRQHPPRENGTEIKPDKRSNTALYEKVERFLMGGPHANNSRKPVDSVASGHRSEHRRRRRPEQSPPPSSVITTSDGSISINLEDHVRPRRPVHEQPVLDQYQQLADRLHPHRHDRAPKMTTSPYPESTGRSDHRFRVPVDRSTRQPVPASAIPARLRSLGEAASTRLPVVNMDFLPSTGRLKPSAGRQTASDLNFSPNITRFVSAKLSQRAVGDGQHW